MHITTSRKLYFVIGILFLILVMILIGILIFRLSLHSSEVTPQAIGNSKVTPSKLPTTETRISPYKNTGAAEDSFTPQQEIEINQERGLRLRSPYDGVTFYISYNYQTFRFDVVLRRPKEQALRDFNSWIQHNYPALDASLFSFREN